MNNRNKNMGNGRARNRTETQGAPLHIFHSSAVLSSYLAKLDGQCFLTRRLSPLPYRFTAGIGTGILREIVARFL